MRGLSPAAASGCHSSLRCAGLSPSRPLLLRSTGSRRAGSAIVAHGPSCSAACGILPDQGSNPCPLHWQADSQPLSHQGSPRLHLYSCPAPRFFRTFLFYFFRFHIYVLAYGICFSLSDSLHSVWQSLGPSTTLQVTQLRFFLWLSNIPLYICATSSLVVWFFDIELHELPVYFGD